MPISVGDTVGHYEILALIGKGGIGELYKAHDPRLKRDVAIKVSARLRDRARCQGMVYVAINFLSWCCPEKCKARSPTMDMFNGRRRPSLAKAAPQYGESGATLPRSLDPLWSD
jgi:serine/threonine protein kinase